MLLKLDVLASTTIKRKKPWPKLAWLGKDVGDLYLFDSHRISQLYLPSGKTKKKIPLLQSYLEDVQGFGISQNGLFVAGALHSGRIFIWNKRSATVNVTAVLDKIRNVHPGTRHAGLLQLYMSDCGAKVLVLVGLRQVFLWETHGSNAAVDTVGDLLKGVWLQIQCGTYLLPDEQDKETAIDGTFFADPLCGTSCTLAWVFNSGDRIHVTTLHLFWPQKTYNFQADTSNNQVEEGMESSFTPSWHTFKHSLYNLTPAERVIKSRKGYIARVSPDGQIVVIAMNQKFASHNRVMFYSLSQSAVAVIADLKGCGAKLNTSQGNPSGRSWWIADMAWTRDSLLVVCITRRGSVCILTKLGEPMEISTQGCSLHTGPALFLPLHPKITFQRPHDAFPLDSTESCASKKDPLSQSQSFSVSVHPFLPVILSSDGYLVTLMQLPPVASYHGIMTGFMREITRLVPDVDVEFQTGALSRASSISRINIRQSEANISREVTSTEFLSDAPSENNSTGSSAIIPGYGMASGDQGRGFFGLNDPELENSLPDYTPGHPETISHAQGLSIVALALGTACGANWKREVGLAMDLTVKVVVKVFQFLLRSSENVLPLRSFSKSFSSPVGDLAKRSSFSPVEDTQLSRALVYFRLSLEVFQWDSGHRNVFAWAFHLTHGIVREILLLRDASVVYRVSCCIRVLKLAERVLNLVYSAKTEDTSGLEGNEPPSQKLVQQESQQVRQESGQEKRGSREDRMESEQDKRESELVKPGTKLVKQDAETQGGSSRKGKDDESDKEVPESSQAQQQTVAQTHLSGSWLLLYNFTSETCKRMQRRRSSLFSAQEGESRGSVEKKMVELLCEIQEKLQMLGVRIPTKSDAAEENIEDINAYLEGTYHNLPPDKPQDSLFSRRRSSVQGNAGNDQSPRVSRRYWSSNKEIPDVEHSRDIPLGLSPAGFSRGNVNEQDSKTLLSILYLQLQQYDLRSALDLVYSLIEPQYSCDHFQTYGTFSLFFSTEGALQVSGHAPTANHRMEALLHNYPIARVGDKRGLKVVQTLARFMAAYFSNLSLYVFPPYYPIMLPPFHDYDQRNAGAKRQGPSQAVEHVPLDRAKVAKAVRDQALHELWSANTTLELFLVSGLVPESALLALNLGDWKNALLLSFANDLLTSRFSQTAVDPEIQILFPPSPQDIETGAIALSRLNPTFKRARRVGEEERARFVDNKLFHSAAAAAKNSQRPQQTALEIGTELDDDKVVKEISRILEAGVVAGLDLVPLILTGLLRQLQQVVSSFLWLVPEEFYLPYPPPYCPQPTNVKKDTMSLAAETEEQLRADVARIVQKILLLLNASNCLGPCVRWYTEKLVQATETWHNVDRRSSEFPVPSSLAGYADRGFSFHDKRDHVAPHKKGKRTAAASASDEKTSDEKLLSSICGVLSSFRDFCAIMWLLHSRDKMSKSSRKYRELRSQSTGHNEETMNIQSICWETLLWTTRLVPFSLLLDATDKINDTLLTLLSELPATTATAGLTAQFFNDPEIVQTASGKAKFKRLMAQFRGVTVQGGEHEDEPLSVFYRKKCIEWERELEERDKLLGKVCDHFFAVPDAVESSIPRHEDHDRAVGTVSFETQPSYFQFLDTFFMIAVSKTVLTHHSKAPYPVPLLFVYNKHLTSADTNALVALQQKSRSETSATPVKAASGIPRSHSFTDVRSSRLKTDASTRRSAAGGDIKRSNSMNDVTKLGFFPGLQTLGGQILDILPSLTWLNRWTLEGSSLPSSSYDVGGLVDRETLSVMRVHVPLPLLVNSLWLLQNVYWPWVSNKEISVNIKVTRQTPPPRRLPKRAKKRSPSVKDSSTPPKGLRKVLSDSNIQALAKRSPKRHSFSSSRLRHRLGADYHHQSTPDMFGEPAQSEAVSLATSEAEFRSDIPTRPQQESPTQVTKPPHKDLRSAQQFHRIPKSNSDPNIPNIVVQSPTTDEEKDFSFVQKKNKTFRGAEGSPTTYHSDTELPSPGRPIVTSTPAKAKRSKKTKRREHVVEKTSDEHKTTSTSVPEIHESDWKKQQCEMKTTVDTTLSEKTSERNTDSRLITRTAPLRQGKRKKKPPVESNVTDNMYENQGATGSVATMDCRQEKETASPDRSQSLATDAVTSQGKMELLLVVRPGNGRDETTSQMGIPLLRIPTVVDSSESSELTFQSHSTRQKNLAKTDTSSQTEQQIMTSSFAQTPQFSGVPGHVTHPHPSFISQTQQHSGSFSDEGRVTRHHHRQSLKTSASQTLGHSGIPSEQGQVVNHSDPASRAMYVQTDAITEPKPPLPVFPFLFPQHQLSGQQSLATNTMRNPQTAQQTQPFARTQRNLPLLHLPVSDPASKLDLSKMRLLEIPKRSSDTPLLHLPETKPAASHPAVPDLSKMKFLEIHPKRELFENTTEQKGPGITGAPSKNWPLLRMTGRQSRSSGIDLDKMRFYENPPSVREAWPLLETPRQVETPQLIPLEKILAFEKEMRDKLKPLSKSHPVYPHEKENIRPPVENKPAKGQSVAQPAGVPVSQNRRNAPTRQRRRQALEKETRPRSKSPLYKSSRGRATSGRKSFQGKVVTVQPSRKARKIEKAFSDQFLHEKGLVTKKPSPNKSQMELKAVSSKEKENVSLSESELELSEISDNVLDISEDEETYFRVDRSPDSIDFIDNGGRQPSKKTVHKDEYHSNPSKHRDKESDHREPIFDDVLPGPPSMRHIKDRIGRRLYEVDQQMSAYRGGVGGGDLGKILRDDSDRQSGHEAARKQNTIGIQVDQEKRPSPVRPVGLHSSNSSDLGGLGSAYKVSSSSQTDKPTEEKDRKLVTSGVQTEKQFVDVDRATSHALVLPPDIFLNLQMPKPDQDNILPPDLLKDYDQSVTDRLASIRGRQIGVDMSGAFGVAPPTSSTDVNQVINNVSVDVRGRQFLSVADIDQNQWLEVQSTPLTTGDEVRTAQSDEEERKEKELGNSAGANTDLSSEEALENSRRDSDTEGESGKDKQDNEKQFFDRPDRVTVEMMDSTDTPFQRFYPLPFPAVSQASARTVSTHALNERVKEMSERIEAMDQITQNMDREFKSSRVLLSAIQSIDEVLNPSPAELKSPGRPHRGITRRWGDTAPWRRGSKRLPEQLNIAEDAEVNVDVDVNGVEKEAEVDVDNVRDSKSASEGTEEQIASEKERDSYKSSDTRENQEMEGSVEMRSDIASEGEVPSDREEKADGKEKEISTEIRAAESVHKKDVPSSTSQHQQRDTKPQIHDPLDSISLTPDKLKQILQEKDIKRTSRDPSPDAREHLKEWMSKKRSERQVEWRNQQEELRAQEHQPFMSPTQGSVTFKKVKLMEKERDTKRRKTEDQHKQKRIESASNLLSEMLAEPVPKPKDSQPNLRYGGSVNSGYAKPLRGKKKRTSDRHKKVPIKGKQKSYQQGIVNETALQESRMSVKGNNSVREGTYPTESLFSGHFPNRGPAKIANVRSQGAPRYDVIRTSSPLVSGEQDQASLLPDNFDRNDDFYIKKKTPGDDFWRSKSPTGAEFVTTQTYRVFAKNQSKRLKARDAALRITPRGDLSESALSSQPRRIASMGKTFARTRPTYPPLPGGETLAEVDRLLEEEDGGFTLDPEKLDGIESLLEGDEELKDLLSDVDWRSISKPKRGDPSGLTGQSFKAFGGRIKETERERVKWSSKARKDYRQRKDESVTPSTSGLLREFDLDVSPWSTGQSLDASDDVAQLLAEVDEAVGNMSESSGSTRSHIDWEEVNKIMGET